jgi:DNA polymerase III epsilon subunit-like protein
MDVVLIVLGVIVVIVVFSKKPQKNKIYLEDKPQKLSVTLELEDSEDLDPYSVAFDLETTGLPKNRDASIYNKRNWPDIVEIAWVVLDKYGKSIKKESHIIKQHKQIPQASVRVHGITKEITDEEGIELSEALESFANDVRQVEYIVSHNIHYDLPILESSMLKVGKSPILKEKQKICTMQMAANRFGRWNGRISLKDTYLRLIGCYGGEIKMPHRAMGDVIITTICFNMMEYGTLITDKIPNTEFEKYYIEIEKITLSEQDVFRGQTAVVTGMFDKIERYHLEECIEGNGGRVTSSLSRKTKIVIIGDEPVPAKIEKIFELIESGQKIRTIRKNELYEILNIK